MQQKCKFIQGIGTSVTSVEKVSINRTLIAFLLAAHVGLE